jgi:hypothetical protein
LLIVQVYFKGKEAMTYQADFYFIDLMQSFITKVASNLLEIDLPISHSLKQLQPDTAAQSLNP